MEHLSLLAGGQEHTVTDWEREAAAVLRKAGRLRDGDADSLVWEKLTRTTLDGIPVAPIGTAESVADVPDPGVPGQAPFTRGTHVRPETGWDIRPSFLNPDAAATAAEILTDLENGATSLFVTVGAGGVPVEGLATALQGVLLDIAPVTLESDDPEAAARAFLAVLGDTTPAPGTNLGADPVGRAVLTGDDADLSVVGVVADLAREAGTLALAVDGTAVHDLGASDAQELGFALATGIAYLRALVEHGLSVDDAASLIEFRYAATDEQFPTIAKFRAARRLWARATELSGVTEERRGQRQHAITSRPMMTKYDPWVNILRTTVASFAAGVGGADSVTVIPFDAAIGLPDAFARRIARNTSALLISEAHVAKVTDPAGGAYAVERLTADLAEAGWKEFQRIEADGGVVAALESIRTRIDEVVRKRSTEIAKRKRPITGVSEFPNLGETLPERAPYAPGARPVRGYADDFEALRDAPAATSVFLATMGTIAAHTARATFVSNLFGAGGIDTVAAGATEGPDDVLRQYDGQPVVCLAGADAAYAAWGADLVSALRAAGARRLILAGKPVEGVDVDDHAAMGVDALAFLTRTREELGA